MSALLRLPSSKTKEDRRKLSRAIEVMLRPALDERNKRQIGWWVIDSYLQGARRFSIIDWNRGLLAVSWEEEDGTIGLRLEEALTKIETEVGRLGRLDLGPKVSKRQNTLESLRNASLAQVFLDQHQAQFDSDEFSMNFIGGLVRYGTYGIGAWKDELSESPLASVRELIPPWELLSVPAVYANPTDLRAVVRTRLFPLAELLAQSSRLMMPDDEGEFEIVNLPYGAGQVESVAGPGLRPGFSTGAEAFDEQASGRTSELGAARRRELREPGVETEKFVRLRELWVLTSRGRVARYVARAGKAVVEDIDFLSQNIEAPMPIGIARYHDTGRFYGRGFAEKVIPMYLELEELMQRAVVTAAQVNRLWFLLVPDTLGLTEEDFLPGDYPKAVFYSPDLAREKLTVEPLMPPDMSDLAERTMAFLATVNDRVVAQGPLFEGEAPGRAESGKFVNILAQTGATHLTPVAAQVEKAMADMYRQTLWITREKLASGPFPEEGLPLARIDNSLAGLKVSGDTGRIVISPGEIPDPFEVDIGIQAADPTQLERRRSEGRIALLEGRLSPLEFVILNYKENWDYPVGQRSVWENYVKAVLYNLILFNDGRTPGVLPGASTDPENPDVVRMPFFNEEFDQPAVHLLAIKDFVAGPVFSLSSPEVQTAFAQRIAALKDSMGQIVPPGFPAIDEASLQAGIPGEGGPIQ